MKAQITDLRSLVLRSLVFTDTDVQCCDFPSVLLQWLPLTFNMLLGFFFSLNYILIFFLISLIMVIQKSVQFPHLLGFFRDLSVINFQFNPYGQAKCLNLFSWLFSWSQVIFLNACADPSLAERPSADLWVSVCTLSAPRLRPTHSSCGDLLRHLALSPQLRASSGLCPNSSSLLRSLETLLSLFLE